MQVSALQGYSTPQTRVKVIFSGHIQARRTEDIEIQRKIKALQQGLAEIVAWDKREHPQNPVIQQIHPKAILTRAQDFLVRQKDADLRMIPYLIGIAGGTASGKTFTKDLLLSKIFPNVARNNFQWKSTTQGKVIDELMVDNYYKDFFEERKAAGDTAFFRKTNLDEPKALTMAQAQRTIQLIKEGITVLGPGYNMTNSKRTENHLYKAPSPFFLVEGLFTLTNRSYVKDSAALQGNPKLKNPFQKLFDLKIFVNTDRETVIDRWWKRAASRNIPGSKDDLSSGGWALLNNGLKMHDQHVAPTMKYADIVINGASEKKALESTLQKLTKLLMNAFYPLKQEQTNSPQQAPFSGKRPSTRSK
jgi:uridine kinase